MASLIPHDAGPFRWRLAPEFARIVGPQGVRLDDWLRGGQATIVKQGPHRVVYRVLLQGVSFYLKHNLIPDRATWARQLIRPSKAWHEYQQALALQQRGIPTAEPLAWAQDTQLLGQGESLLVTRGLDHTQTLHHFLEHEFPKWAVAGQTRFRQRLAAVLGIFMARLHDAGIRHNDLHAGNILLRFNSDGEPELFLIDLTAVRIGPPLAWRQSKNNLVIVNRWFMTRASRSDRLRFWRAYLQARGALPEKIRWPRIEEPKLLARELERATWRSLLQLWRQRDRRCLAKNRYYQHVHGAGVVGHAVARLDRRFLDALLADPELPFRHPGAVALKQSSGTAVIEFDAVLNGQTVRLVYKRFPVRRWSQPWAALVRQTPALRSWCMGQGFCERGLPTARPLLVLERSQGALKREGYLLMEKLDRTLPLHEYLQSLAERPAAQRRRILGERLRLVARAVRELHRRQLDHRDLKANNLLLSEGDAPQRRAEPVRKSWASPAFLPDPLPGVWFIDLVGVRTQRKLTRRRRQQNLARLNASFQKSPHLSRTDRLRFLRAYLTSGLVGKQGWKTWWRAIAALTMQKVERNQRLGRILA